MVYSQSWDEGAPLGTADAGTLETIIQNLKIGLRERLEQVIPDFGNDGVDPKTLDAGQLNPNHKGKATLTSAQSIANDTPQTVTWDSEEIDVGDIIDLGTNDDRITVSQAGVYLVVCHAVFASNATGRRSVGAIRNGSGSLGSEALPASSGVTTNLTFTVPFTLAASDYISMSVRQNSGGALNLNIGSFLAVIKLL